MTPADALRQRRRSEDGVALIFVLGAIVLTSLVIVALLGLSLASARLTAVQERQARERRAADGALETGIGRLERSIANNPCNDIPANSTVTADHELDAAGDPIDVQLRCRPLPLPTVSTPSAPSPDVLGGPGVEIVGPTYGGGLTVPAGGVADSTLVASGVDPLRFDADLTVARGANVSSSTATTSGATVAGQYLQGVDGAGGSPASPCGTLDPAGGDVPRSLSDRDARPVCADAAAAALAPRRGTLFSPTEPVDDRSVDPCPDPSAPGVIEFAEGRYDAIDTARLNDLLDGSCRNKTFWFRHGKYLFDVNDASAAATPAGERFALVIDDPSAKVVFGESSGWSPTVGPAAADFPRACDVASSGASLQLTGRSTVRHRAGRVAICPYWNPGTDLALPAIVQGGSSPSQPILVGTDLPVGGVLPQVVTQCWSPVLWWFQWLYCSDTARTRTVTTTWAATGSAQLDSAVLLVEVTESPPVHQARNNIQVRVARPGFSCTTGVLSGGRTHRQYTAIDLMSPANPGNCRAELSGRSESIFEGATITIDLTMFDPGDPNGLPLSNCGEAPGCRVTYTVGQIALRTNMVGVAPSAATGADWVPGDNVRSLDGAVARVAQDEQCIVADERCRNDREDATRSITVTGFDPAGAGLAADEPVEHLGLRLESADTGASWASDEIDDTWVRIDLALPAFGALPARTCSVTQNGFSRSRRAVHVDLFPVGGTCRALVERVEQLQNATATVSVRSRCMWFGPARAPSFGGRCNQVRLPEFDRIQLDVTPALLQRAPAAEVTIDAAATTDGSTFNVFGDTLTPDLDLDLRWRGAVTDLPLFGGVMSIRSLGSSQATGATMGVVCCTPPAVSTLLLEAMIDTVVKAEAQLYVGRPGSGGAPPQVPELRRSVAVRDWSFCRDDCTEVLSATTVPVPAAGP